MEDLGDSAVVDEEAVSVEADSAVEEGLEAVEEILAVDEVALEVAEVALAVTVEVSVVGEGALAATEVDSVVDEEDSGEASGGDMAAVEEEVDMAPREVDMAGVRQADQVDTVLREAAMGECWFRSVLVQANLQWTSRWWQQRLQRSPRRRLQARLRWRCWWRRRWVWWTRSGWVRGPRRQATSLLIASMKQVSRHVSCRGRRLRQ